MILFGLVQECMGLMRIYGPNEDSQRGALWEELSRMHSRWNVPWCVIGGFLPSDTQVRD